jgi:signal transduction histidine kinase
LNGRGIMGTREQLIDLIIHDLTGPLSVISSTVSSLLEKEERYGPLAERQRSGLERILRNSRKAEILLQEMLEIARSEDGVFQAASFPVEQALREALLDVLENSGMTGLEDLRRARGWEAFQRAIEIHGFLVEVTGRYARDPFFHDWRKVRQVMRNLLSNALKWGERDHLTYQGWASAWLESRPWCRPWAGT